MRKKKTKTNEEKESLCLDSMGLEEGIILSVRSGRFREFHNRLMNKRVDILGILEGK